jgi:hypothetical protein
MCTAVVTPMGMAIAKYPTITAATLLHMAGQYTPIPVAFSAQKFEFKRDKKSPRSVS